MSSEAVAPHRRSRAPRADELAPEDWLEAGLRLLRRGGLKTLKLRALALELGVSTGSFYHHFRDFDAYQARLASFFSGPRIDALLAAMHAREADPVARIRALAVHVERRNLSQLALAMRAWAESDANAAEAVRSHDAKVMAFLAQCLEDAGFDVGEARLRSHAILSVGLGLVHYPHPTSPDQLRDAVIDLLCRASSETSRPSRVTQA
ncbi:TetR/AcrR family transcriptional regulator [Stakelama marina]|uniref:TetR/AcrR family transcriptional regulator n=1 Tax=Stakelama marina TaxID=2826939 RepID=A0A8T4IDK5_9SPHN|nr:TetR/AcrR family transcriptional regulator [Stakelama marina]MBR0553098.1 TetR/AcrR family transcriptional regulator [Stakelama marina]